MLPVLFAATTVASFFSLAHMAVRTTPGTFALVARVMLVTGAAVAVGNLAAGAGVVCAVLLARRLGPDPISATVPAWFEQSR